MSVCEGEKASKMASQASVEAFFKGPLSAIGLTLNGEKAGSENEQALLQA